MFREVTLKEKRKKREHLQRISDIMRFISLFDKHVCGPFQSVQGIAGTDCDKT